MPMPRQVSQATEHTGAPVVCRFHCAYPSRKALAAA